MTDPNTPAVAARASLGGHELPAYLSGSPEAPRRRRRGLVGWIVGSLGALAVVAAFALLQVSANLGYDAAEDGFDASVSTATPIRAGVGDESAALEATSAAAASILQNDSGRLVDAATRDALAGTVADADEVTAAAVEILAEDIPTAGEKPGWFWELFGATRELEDDRADVEELVEDLRSQSTSIDAASTAVDDAGVSFLLTAADSAAGFEAAHISARNDAVIQLRNAATDLSGTEGVDQYAVDSFLALETAATQVVETEQAELAEKAGPLQGPRLEVEAFARSLAPGVLLEFDWAPIVNGFGTDGGMGGYATWWWDEPDRATIQLSNSVAEQWPSARSQALVAHEVGHAISVKCEGMYDASTQESIEAWATAWAISMGYTDDANGVWAYGYPPQSYIDAAMGCR